MNRKLKLLTTLSNEQLLKIVSNYKIYNYNQDVQIMAFNELNSRGVYLSEKVVSIHKNQKFHYLNFLLTRFKEGLKFCSIVYKIGFSCFLLAYMSMLYLPTISTSLRILYPLIYIVYIIKLLLIFRFHTRFYKLTGNQSTYDTDIWIILMDDILMNQGVNIVLSKMKDKLDSVK